MIFVSKLPEQHFFTFRSFNYNLVVEHTSHYYHSVFFFLQFYSSLFVFGMILTNYRLCEIPIHFTEICCINYISLVLRSTSALNYPCKFIQYNYCVCHFRSTGNRIFLGIVII